MTFDRALLNELATLRFLDAHAHVTIVGPVGVGKTFLAHALGHVACRRGATVLAVRTDQMLKLLKHARLDNSYDAELRNSSPLTCLSSTTLPSTSSIRSRVATSTTCSERYRTGSVIVTSNRGPDEWLATFRPVRAQSAIDRFTSNAYDLIIEGESYRPRLKPRLAKEPRRARDDAHRRRPVTRGRSAAATHRLGLRPPPPSACRLALDQSRGRNCRTEMG